MTLRQLAKQALVYSGIRPSFAAWSVLGCLEFGQWLKRHPIQKVFPSRRDQFKHLNDDVLQNASIDYLEFGVFRGTSMRLWTGNNRNLNSRFFGFDSFKGFTEDWKSAFGSGPKDSFDLKGAIPTFDDQRVTIIPGYFHETLPKFLESFSPRNRLVVNIDCDIYSSTLFVLTSLAKLLVPGTILYFDEFNLVNHEFRAFLEFTNAYQRPYKVLSSSDEFYIHIAFEMQ